MLEGVEVAEMENEGPLVGVTPPEMDGRGDPMETKEAVPVDEGVIEAKGGVGVTPKDTLAPSVLTPDPVPLLEGEGGEDRVEEASADKVTAGDFEPLPLPLPSPGVADEVALPPPPNNPPLLLVALGVPETTPLLVTPPRLLVDDTLGSPLTVKVPEPTPLLVPPTKSVGDLDMLADRV